VKNKILKKSKIMIKFLNKKSLSFTLTSKFGLGRQKQASFTLIELLVVIAIIGILATIVLVSLSNARTKARDARRETDMHQFSVAMEMYYGADNNNPHYPDLPPDVATAIPALAHNLAPFMDPAALDPSNPSRQYFWSDCGDITHQQYCVWATLENPSTPTTYYIANPRGTKETTIPPSCSATPKCYDL